MLQRESIASLGDCLPWRIRRTLERVRLKSLRFVRGLDSLVVQTGVPSASLTAVGDMAFATSEGEIGTDIEQFVAMVEPIFHDTNLRIGNLETPLTNARKSDQSIGSLLRASPAAVSLLVAAKMDVVNLANNHARDCRHAGLMDCCKLLEQHGIRHCGTGGSFGQSRSEAQVETAGVKIAVLGYCDNYRVELTPAEVDSPLPAEDNRVVRDIRYLRAEVDIVIVQLHWGYEFSFHPPITYRNRARSYVEAGADLVLCHHSHLPMGTEVWKKGLISHGLGNFIFPPDAYLRAGHPWTNRSYALRVFFNSSGVLSAEIIPFVIRDHGLPETVTGHARSEILGAVARTSSRLNDDGFLDWIEKDRTIRETLTFMSLFLCSDPPFAREMALQLRSPFRQDTIRHLSTTFGEPGKHAARLLSEIAEAALITDDFAQFTSDQKQSVLFAAMVDLRRLNPLPNDPPGRLP